VNPVDRPIIMNKLPSGKVDDAPREHLDDPFERKGSWSVFCSTR